MTNPTIRSYRRLRVFSLTAAATVLFVSCGYKVEVDLSTPPAAPHTSLTASPPSSARTISIARPKGPALNTTIGEFDHGFAPIVVRNDPGLWVANALVARLEETGYRVERAETPSTAQTPIVIAVEVTEVSCNRDTARSGFIWAEYYTRVIARVQVYKTNSVILQRTYSGSWVGPDLPGTFRVADSVEHALDEALSDLLNQAVPDLTAFLAKTEQAASVAPPT